MLHYPDGHASNDYRTTASSFASYLTQLCIRLRLCLPVLLLQLVILSHVPYCRAQLTEPPSVIDLGLIKKLYHDRDFHRSISEILRLKFEYPQSSAIDELYLNLIKCYYQLGDFAALDRAFEEISTISGSKLGDPVYLQISLLVAASWIKRNNPQQAIKIWGESASISEYDKIPVLDSVKGTIDS